MTGPGRRRLVQAVAAGAVFVLGAGTAPALAAPGPAAYPEYWFDQWGVSSLWAKGIRGDGVTVAILDTGVQASVRQLAGKVLPGADLTGLGGDGRTDRALQSFSHGTAMASLIVAEGDRGYVNGVAPHARILPIAVPLDETRVARGQHDQTPRAIRWAADHGAKVISMSFGAARRPSISSTPCPVATQAAVFHALAKGAIVVAASGNAGEKGSPVEEPSVCLGVISVGAVNRRGTRPPFSSVHRYLTVAAPGDAVTSLNRDGDVFVGSGTSQAAALTSGALALIWSAHPRETNRQITARLMAGLHDIGPPGRDREFGFGLVDAGASVRAAPTPSTPNPVFTGADPFLQALTPRAPARLTPPPPAATETPPGEFDRAGPPAAFEHLTLTGGAVALAGLLGLMLVAVTGRRRPSGRAASPVAT